MIAPATAALAAVRVSTPPPPLASLVLAPADLRPGAVVGSQVTTSYDGRELLLRTFKPGARITDAPLLGAVSAAVLDPDTPTAVADYKELNGETQTTQGRLLLAKQWATDFVKGINAAAHGKSKLTLEHTVVGEPAELGPSTLRLPLMFKTSRGTIRMILEVVQADRTLSILELISPFNGRLGTLDATKALAAIQQHLHVAFTVSNTTPPTISGTPTQGQVVAVDEGDWAGAPSTFSYSWARCDAAGANCTPIAGATTNRYSVDPADVGSTIRVTVTGANSLSSQQGVSAATAVVG
ncbi:MAG TPA: hypothetical protein VEH55_06330 [Gaiellaceae bacterium]|nr:hypothetical protein [Gaiellaceae bacterium]